MISPYVFPGLKVNRVDKTQQIIDIVCSVYNVKFSKIDNKDRHREIIQIRQAIMYFLRKETSLSLKGISELFYYPFDHTTIISNIKVYYNVYPQDNRMKQNHKTIIEKLSAI